MWRQLYDKKLSTYTIVLGLVSLVSRIEWTRFRVSGCDVKLARRSNVSQENSSIASHVMDVGRVSTRCNERSSCFGWFIRSTCIASAENIVWSDGQLSRIALIRDSASEQVWKQKSRRPSGNGNATAGKWGQIVIISPFFRRFRVISHVFPIVCVVSE